MPENKDSEQKEWRLLPSEMKQKWLGDNNLQGDERTLWEKHAPEVFEDLVHYSQGLFDNLGLSDQVPMLIDILNATDQKRQLAYAYEYKMNLLSQAQKADVAPHPIEYEHACENIGYEIGFLCGCISVMKYNHVPS
jgi:hypothetical protein